MKNLIIYFSWSGNTDKLVKQVNSRFNFDVIKIEKSQPYSRDYNTCAYVEAKKEWESHIHPDIKELSVDVDNYDTILLFCPIWWYTIPMPVATFIEKLKDYKGQIVMFENSYTNDSTYAKNALKEVENINTSLNVKQGLFNKSVEEHVEFIKNLNKQV